MNCVLIRDRFEYGGIFGELSTGDGELHLHTLEHAYAYDNSTWVPKLPAGTYSCVRGKHQLAHMKEPFETFEITGVPGHKDILFHVGNFNVDSEGCVLLGLVASQNAIACSREAFERFMKAQEGCAEFSLIVVDEPADSPRNSP